MLEMRIELMIFALQVQCLTPWPLVVGRQFGLGRHIVLLDMLLNGLTTPASFRIFLNLKLFVKSD